tara:strand:- start:625 stop:798 length:174 start_codon:yes stop_codon:yes gene_type:complete
MHIPKKPKLAYAKAKEVAKVIYFEAVKLSLNVKKGQTIRKVKIKDIIIFQISWSCIK